MEITSTDNGWHTTTLRVMNRASGVVEERTYRWRTERIECCGQPITVSDGTTHPIWFGDYAELRTLGKQCPNCGSHYSATVWEVQ